MPLTGFSHEQDSGNERSWLSNASYQPPAPPVCSPSDTGGELPKEDISRSPPSKKNREERKIKKPKDSRRREKKEGRSQVPDIELKPKTNWFDDCGLAPSDAYRLDSHPDHTNVEYDALYSGDIAVYRRHFGGKCMGLGPHQAIEWTDNRGKKEGKKLKTKQSRYFTDNLPQNDSCVCITSQLSSRKGGLATTSGKAPFFIALESVRATESASDTVEGGFDVTQEVYVSQRTATYNQALQNDPHNVQLWMEFLDFQKEASVWERGVGGAVSGKVARAIDERKLAIFERALEHNPSSEELLVGHLELLRDSGRGQDAILKKWKDLLFRMPNKPLLWIKYTEFFRMEFSTFTTASLSALYHKGIATLTAILEGTMQSHRPEPDTARYLLVLFTQYCYCLAASGQSERAIACYQALLEYNLCCPVELTSSQSSPVTHKQKIAFFEPFWDSGAPRLGESGAVGWNQWMQASQNVQNPKSLSLVDASFLVHSDTPLNTEVENEEKDPELVLIAGQSLSDAWLILENYRQEQDVLPFRGPEDELTDPEHAVLFEDVSQCLFTITERHLLLQLVLQFLQFLGTCTVGSSVLDHLSNLISAHLQCALDALPSLQRDRVGSILSGHLHCPSATYSFCGVGAGYSTFSSSLLLQHHDTEHPPPHPKVCEFISNFCNQTLSLFTEPETQTSVALTWINFEVSLLFPVCHDPVQGRSKSTKHRIKAVQKLTKSLLKLEAHRNNLALWDCCAQLELLLVGIKESCEMYEIILSQHATITPQLLPLYVHYCQVLMGLQAPLNPASTPQTDFSLALHSTVCVAVGKYSKMEQGCPVPPSDLLRARYLYEQRAVTESSPSFITCYAYFEYFTRGLEPACKVWEQYVESLRIRLSSLTVGTQEYRTLQAYLHQTHSSQCRLMLWHTDFKPMPPTVLWTTLEQALVSFPEDPYFLSAYTDSHQPLYLMGKLRKYFDTHCPKALSAVPWVHAVRAEIALYHRVQEGGVEAPTGLLNRIQALLDRATHSPNGRGCPLLWRLAIVFEVNCML